MGVDVLFVALESHIVPRPGRERAYPRVADMLIELRKRADITQEEMARRVGLTLSGYRTYEQGRRNLSQDQIPVFARALGVPISAVTIRLWPEDQPELVETRYSVDMAELQQQLAGLPPERAERVLRWMRESLEIASGTADLVRRN